MPLRVSVPLDTFRATFCVPLPSVSLIVPPKVDEPATVKVELEEVLLLPTLWLGASQHHLRFGATLTTTVDVYINVLCDLLEPLLEDGYQRVLLLNGHGGNIAPGKFALNILSDLYDDTCAPNIALATYWELAGSAFDGDAPMETPAHIGRSSERAS